MHPLEPLVEQVLMTVLAKGTDVPFINQGDEDIAINEINYLNSPRVIASRVNELNTSTLNVLPGDRSFNMTLNLAIHQKILFHL